MSLEEDEEYFKKFRNLAPKIGKIMIAVTIITAIVLTLLLTPKP